MLNNEIWKDIEGFNKDYQVSNLGRVKSLKNGKEKILSLSKTANGYYKCSLWKNNVQYYKKIHRLVAEAFIPNPYNLYCVNHKDEDKTNNCVDILEWCTLQYNLSYGTGRERSIEHRQKPVRQYNKNKEIEAVFPSLRIASEETGIKEANISACCLKKAKTAGGYIWRYGSEVI
jgi:hypothetical protein